MKQGMMPKDSLKTNSLFTNKTVKIHLSFKLMIKILMLIFNPGEKGISILYLSNKIYKIILITITTKTLHFT